MPAPNRNSPISPMQVRSPASVHSGHSMHSISPGPQQSPANSQPSPGVHNMKSPSMCAPVHQSPANTPVPSITSPAQTMQPLASPMQAGSSTGQNQSSPASYTSAMCSPNQAAAGHFSPNDVPINSPVNSSPNYSMCSVPRNNQPVSSPYIDSQPTSTHQYVTTTSGSGQALSNPLQSLQKLVMLPESQVVDPKSVVNDGSLSGEAGSKNDEGGELATPVGSPKPCLDGRHCGNDNENLQHDFQVNKPKEEPQIVSMPSYSGSHAYRGTPRCLENQFNQPVDGYYDPMAFQGNLGTPHGYRNDPPMLSPNYVGNPYMATYDSHIKPPVLTNYDERTEEAFGENNISLPPKKKQKRVKKSDKLECGKKGKNKIKNSQDKDACGNMEMSNINIRDAPSIGQNQSDTDRSCSTIDTGKCDVPSKANSNSKVTDNLQTKFTNKVVQNNEMEKLKVAKEREAEYDFTDDNDEDGVKKIEQGYSAGSLTKENSPVNGTVMRSPQKSPGHNGNGSVTKNKIRKRATYSRENYLGSFEDRSLVNDFDVVLDNCVTNSTFRTLNGDTLSTVHSNGALLTRVSADILPGSCLSRLKVRKAPVRTWTNGTTNARSQTKLKTQLKLKRKTRVNAVKLCESDGEIYSSDPEDYIFPLAEKTAQVDSRDVARPSKKRGRPKNSLKLDISHGHHDQENTPNCVKPKIHKTATDKSTNIHVNDLTLSKVKAKKASGKSDTEKSPRSDGNNETEKGPKEMLISSENSVEELQCTKSKSKTGFDVQMAAAETTSPTTEKSLDLIKKGSGEKKSSPNSSLTSSNEVSPETGKKKRGRPFGSKNKVKCTRRRKKENQEVLGIDPVPSCSENFKSMKLKKTLDLVTEQSKKGKKRKFVEVKKEKPIGPYIKANGPNDNPISFKVINIPDFENEKLNQKKKSRLSDFSEKPAYMPPVSSLNERIPFLCALCGQSSNYQMLGDLFGPYFKETSPTHDLGSPKSESKNKDTECDKKKRKQKSEEKKCMVAKKPKSDTESVPSEMWVHEDCAVWSHGVYLHGRKIHGLEDAISVAKQSTCTACKTSGATVGCFYKGCNVKFHFMCATEKECLFDEENFSLLCPKHKEKKLKSKAP